jgi:protein-S-isoprenylcysteine O-methyltransferase Ste14
MNNWKQIRAILLLPGLAAILIPSLILYRTRKVNLGWSLEFSWRLLPPILGLLFAGLGLLLMFKTIQLFITVGRGTLAPWDPPQRLVVRGIYRHVRNPMISGVSSLLLGEAIFFGSWPIFQWFLLFVLVNLIYMPLVEEPGLDRRFGEEYRRYKQHVPRWIPRLSPWRTED